MGMWDKRDFPSRAQVEAWRKEYPVGTVVRLLSMDDIQAPPSGTLATVTGIDDGGNMHVDWQNCRGSLAIIPDEDKFEVVSKPE